MGPIDVNQKRFSHVGRVSRAGSLCSFDDITTDGAIHNGARQLFSGHVEIDI